jgi:hypothetical protein
VACRGYSEHGAKCFAIPMGVKGSRYLAGDASTLLLKISSSIKCSIPSYLENDWNVPESTESCP